MIELIFRVPVYIWKEADERSLPIKLEVDRDLASLSMFLNRDPFYLSDLSDYEYREKLRVVKILPDPEIKKDRGYFIEIKAYSDSPVLSDQDIVKIKNHIKAQVSNGWGYGGFDLYSDMKLGFDCDEIDYKGHNFLGDKEYKEISDNYKNRSYQANMLKGNTRSKDCSDFSETSPPVLNKAEKDLCNFFNNLTDKELSDLIWVLVGIMENRRKDLTSDLKN